MLGPCRWSFTFKTGPLLGRSERIRTWVRPCRGWRGRGSSARCRPSATGSTTLPTAKGSGTTGGPTARDRPSTESVGIVVIVRPVLARLTSGSNIPLDQHADNVLHPCVGVCARDLVDSGRSSYRPGRTEGFAEHVKAADLFTSGDERNEQWPAARPTLGPRWSAGGAARGTTRGPTGAIERCASIPSPLPQLRRRPR